MKEKHWRFCRRWVGYNGCNNEGNLFNKRLKLNILLAIEQKSGIWTGVSPKDHIVYKNGSTSEWFPRDLAWAIMQSFITC